MDELKVELMPDEKPNISSSSLGSASGGSSSSFVAKETANVLLNRSFYRLRDFRLRLPATKEVSARDAIWMDAALGESRRVRVPLDELKNIQNHMSLRRERLGEWPSTAICGNDILASVLYSSGIVTIKAGKLTPWTQLLVALVLYFYRYIYEEVVTAIPLNGGSYNVLLNTTSKRVASIAATLGIISYLATGVVSATSAIQYLNNQISVDIVFCSVLLLFAFAMLSLIGIGESSRVALSIFIFHVVSLTVLGGFSLVYAVRHPEVYEANMKTNYPPVDLAGTLYDGNFFTAIFFGYSSAMLGITGFETSAQFVEQQEPGVFRKTLRNMWLFATVYNVLLSFLSLAVLPLGDIFQFRDVVLALMGQVTAGRFMSTWVSIDAFVVLAGGVLTSYVGIIGLVRRLAMDRVLPGFLTQVNSWRRTNHYIIMLFFVLQASFVILLNAEASALAGVFTFAFLAVMSLFAMGCMLLKLKREAMPRDVKAPWWSCVFGLIMVLLGLLGNLLGDPAILTYFALYFVVFMTVVLVMLERVFILRFVLFALQLVCPSRFASVMVPPLSPRKKSVKSEDLEADNHRNAEDDARVKLLGDDGPRLTDSLSSPSMVSNSISTDRHTGARGGRTIVRALQEIHLPPIIFFCKAPDLSRINKAILYVRQNENTRNLRIIHVWGETINESKAARQSEFLKDFGDVIVMFDLMYPKLKIDFVAVEVPMGNEFDASVVEWLSFEMRTSTNMMFICQPSTKRIHQVSALGVRVIL